VTFWQELNETVSRSRVVVEEVDGRLQTEYESRLKDALQEMREDNEEQIRKLRDETEAMYERKVSDSLMPIVVHMVTDWMYGYMCGHLTLSQFICFC
jgi:hypothetical protein